MTEFTKQFYNDKEVARLLGMSVSWVRVQRFNRRHGKPHVLDLDPVQLGSSPRYERTAIEQFIAKLVDDSKQTADAQQS